MSYDRTVTRSLLVVAATLCACGDSQQSTDALTDAAVGGIDLATPAGPDLSINCPGAPASVALVEGYCKAGEADRCFYAQPPMDGF